MDEKKLDRLIKLIKLANHNSAEGEANSAARAACRILGEDNYNWITNALTVKSSSRPSSAGTWNDVNRSDKTWWRSKPPPSAGNPFEEWDWGKDTGFDWNAYYENAREEAKRRQAEYETHSHTYEDYAKREEARKERTRREKEKRAQSWTWTGERSGNKGFKKVYTQKCRNCTVCGITRLTTDEDTPYICYECRKKK